MIKKRIRHIQRYRDIVYAFTKYGFGFIINEMGLTELLAVPKKVFAEGNKTLRHKTTGERIRLFLEELGPTFVKMGQIASTRPDMIPADMIQELVKLQDQVQLFPFKEVERIIEHEFAESMETLFAAFSEQPLAAASIGQVHYAELHTGERVAVKIQRPNIRKIIETDLEILQDLARLAEAKLNWAERYQIRDIVAELAQSIRLELDYEIEGRNAEKIARQFSTNPDVRIPKIYWENTTPKVLTMEYLEGVKLNEVEKLHKEGYESKILAERVVNAVFQQILIDGFFHGDPHPGNILALPGNAIAFMDFGIIGQLTPEMKQYVSSFVIAMMNQNTDEVVRTITNMGLVPDEVNHRKLRADVDMLREKYSRVPFSEMSLGRAVNDLFSVAFRHRIRIPTDLTILGKTLLTMEGMVEKLNPELSIIKIAKPFGRRLIKERFHPKNVAEKVRMQFSEYEEIFTEMPQTLKDITTIMKKGKMKIEITTPELDLFLKKVNRISNRMSFSIVLLAFSIIMAGVIIGASLSGQTSTMLTKIPAIEIGFVIATTMFLWLLYSIFKSGRF
ncbi:AarF/ABC1/UbiB kinase family protein [Neobacillus sp. OS1-2]|uniref:ABC1 kinase family protein n=1 Tax=Neobacillus sp. OS1-2 TaxID=3070680 RepID=UPI0027E149FB|nr:AarF/ABC1/UbiB kinase family protein [Neobacillus sp. OS1-2]WML38835.1 AarF/ABC1/UbiB kinase family protein [Neobacillus sp. OS1-2]